MITRGVFRVRFTLTFKDYESTREGVLHVFAEEARAAIEEAERLVYADHEVRRQRRRDEMGHDLSPIVAFTAFDVSIAYPTLGHEPLRIAVGPDPDAGHDL